MGPLPVLPVLLVAADAPLQARLAGALAASGPLMRPKENKQQVTMRFDADVLAFYRGQGRGWQSRMNAVLRSFMERGQGPDERGR